MEFYAFVQSMFLLKWKYEGVQNDIPFACASIFYKKKEMKKNESEALNDLFLKFKFFIATTSKNHIDKA